MLGAISASSAWGWGYMPSYAALRQPAAEKLQPQETQAARTAAPVTAARRAASPEVPVQPVDAAPPVGMKGASDARLGLPIREGVDPAEMAVRMRIRYIGAEQAPGAETVPGAPESQEAADAESIQEIVEEGTCQTCRERKYQDGSDDPGVSFKTPAHIDAGVSASVVRGHEMEHVYREQAAARREGREVVSQSVTLHSAICPECGRVYISGGTTRTTTAAAQEYQELQRFQQEVENGKTPGSVFSAVA